MKYDRILTSPKFEKRLGKRIFARLQLGRSVLLCCLLLAMLFCITTPVYANAQNLLSNGDFSELQGDGLPAKWQTHSWQEAVQSTEFYTVQDPEVGTAVVVESLVENDAWLQQTVKVQPETYYRVTAMVQASNVGMDTKGLNLSTENCLQTSEDIKGSTDGWQQLELIGKTAKNQKELTVLLRLGGYGSLNTGYAAFANVYMEMLDAPPAGASVVDFATAEPQTQDDGELSPETVWYKQVPIVLFFIMAFFFCYFWIVRRGIREVPILKQPGETVKAGKWLAVMVGLGILIRLILAYKSPGYPTDVQCFTGWAEHARTYGLRDFYSTVNFCDYPPLSIVILDIIAFIAKILGTLPGEPLYGMLLNLPAILSDGLIAILVFYMARKKLSKSVCFALSALCVINPAVIFNSSVFGQMDSVLALFLLLAFYLMLGKYKSWGILAYAVGLMVKPQALLFGPVLLLMVLLYCVRNKDGERRRMLLSLLKGGGAALIMFLAVMLFFGKGQNLIDFIIRVYFNSTQSYPYAVINAFNLFAIFNGNWMPINNTFLGIPYAVVGYAFMVLVIALAVILYFKRKQARHVFLIAALMMLGFFCLGPMMHERYAFVVIFLLLCAFIYSRDRRLLLIHALFTVTTFINIAIVLCMGVEVAYTGIPESFTWIMRALSLGNLVLFGFLVKVAVDILWRGRVRLYNDYTRESPAYQNLLSEREQNISRRIFEKTPPENDRLGMTRKDHLLMWGLTLIYAVVAFVNLGTTAVPQTYYRALSAQEWTIDLGETRDIRYLRTYAGIGYAKFNVTVSDDNENWQTAMELDIDGDNIRSMLYKWKDHELSVHSGRYVKITVERPPFWMEEMAVVDENYNVLPIAQVLGEGTRDYKDSELSHLFDEQQLAEQTPSYLNGMYFDEVYHGRTGYEHAMGLAPYENSHPPLGKVFIAAGIKIFGMNPFGWRCMGTLAGILMIPVIYMLGKRLFKKTNYAFLVALLFTVDFMHFVQTRIATVDSYAILFLLLTYYFMYRYMQRSFNNEPFKKTAVPLLWSGIFFGLGAATKWICLYAAVGLLAMLVYTWVQRYKEYAYAKKMTAGEDCPLPGEQQAQLKRIARDYWFTLFRTLIWCVVFFIIIPAAIYLASYLPYILSVEKPYSLAEVWGLQEFMWSYHSDLTATHPYASSVLTWPFIVKPTWFFDGSSYLGPDTVSSISTMGNPIVWLLGFAAIVYVLVKKLRRQTVDNRIMLFILIGFAAQYLPWMLITRPTFIYHYFASTPFIILALVYMLRDIETARPKLKWLKWAIAGAAVVLFCMFYPILSGYPVPKDYVSNVLRWLPSWTFFI